MSLEQFKTQILLLHSEQSTLDNLSAGFGERYTVHCATSGSEALNTLGETSIDVLVSAQDLPGMSGLDALREAKKRSPDTIGILLAGNDGDVVESLVGARELFQVVRGGVTAESLRNVIDNATQQSRLMALAESANDTTALLDDSSGEHIVMETSENGSAIISDGTGRMPILNPEKVAAVADVSSRAVDVLVLTKDQEFLATLRESARGMHNIINANTLAMADEALRSQKIGVAVIDAAMVGENVEKLTVHLRKTTPRLVSIVAGRRDDGEMLMDLINRGKVYRFLLKPVSPGRSRLAIEASVKHHLEAPDAAFRVAGSTAPAQAAAPARKAPPAAAPAPRAPASAPAVKPKPAAVPAAPTAQAQPESSRPAPFISADSRLVPAESPTMLSDALGEAFGGDEQSFTETMTGIVSTVGAKFSSVTSHFKSDEKVSDSGGSIFSDPKILGIGAAAIVAILGIGWWMLGGSSDPLLNEESIAEAPSVIEADVSLGAASEMVEEARLAASAGQVFNPPGSNAIELYLAADTAVPGNATITAELQATIEQALGMAESSILARRPQEAAAALERVALADPGNDRLAFLNAQLVQAQLRDYLDSARVAIRENRFEDAALALDGARAVNSGDAAGASLIAEVAGDLISTLSAQKVEDVLANANKRLADGKLTTPSNDNARYYFELALSNDPGNAAARQGLNVVASKLVLQARSAIDSGNLDAAAVLLADARRLNQDSDGLAAAERVLIAERDLARQAQEAQLAAANEKQAAELAAAERAAAEQAAAEQAAADQAAAQRAAAAKQAPVLQVDVPAADANTIVAGNTQAEFETLTTSEPEVPARVDVRDTTPVAVSSLTRLKYVAPKYPRSAQRRSQSGWVDLVFTVDIDGTVRDVSVRDSDPGVVFVNSAVSAVEDWEFEPVSENGVMVQKRAAVRMLFAVED